QGGRGLNEQGRAQAARLAARLKATSLTAIVASDLERAVETASIVSQACGIPVELESGLREIDVGAWTGKSYEEILELFAGEWGAWERGLGGRRGGGETYVELAERMDGAIKSIACRHGPEPEVGHHPKGLSPEVRPQVGRLPPVVEGLSAARRILIVSH